MIGVYSEFWKITPEQALKTPYYIFETFSGYIVERFEEEKKQSEEMTRMIKQARNGR